MNDNVLAADEDAMWREDGERNGWTIRPAPWPLRLWGVRHIRYFVHAWNAESAALDWLHAGIGTGQLHPRDAWMLHAILKGYA
jgi:hypothetical protein